MSDLEGQCLCVICSAFAERGFCRTCGTHIFHRPQNGPELAVNSGLFPPDDLFFAREIFSLNAGECGTSGAEAA